MPNVQIITEIDGDELWSRIWGSEPQSFGSWWRGLTFPPGSGWDKAGEAWVTLEDAEDGEGTDKVVKRVIRLDDIAKALNNLSFPSHLRQHIMDDNADCIDSDAVIQFIVYGEIVYG